MPPVFGFEEGAGNRRVDLHPADVQTIEPTAVDHGFACAMVARGTVATPVVSMQPPPALAAHRQPL